MVASFLWRICNNTAAVNDKNFGFTEYNKINAQIYNSLQNVKTT